MNTKPLYPLTLLQHALLTALRKRREGVDLLDLHKIAERLDPHASLGTIAKRTAAALERLALEGVIELWHSAPDGLLGARSVERLDAEARACLLLSKPIQERHARTISRKPKHEQRGEALPAQPTPDSGGTPAADPCGVSGEQGPAGADAPASPTPEEAPAVPLLAPGATSPHAPQSTNAAGLDSSDLGNGTEARP